MKKIMFLILSMILATTLAACSSDSASGSGDKGKITVGGKDFTEQHILTKMTSILLKEKGYKVDEASSMGSTVARSALENGQLDLYWEYTGTALLVYLKQPLVTDPDKAYEKVKELDKKNGLAWLNKSDFNNTYAILMREDRAKELGISSLDDLANYINNNPNKLKFASNAEFFARADGLKGLEKKYGFDFPAKNIVKMDSGLVYNALNEKQVDVTMGFATDGRIKGFNLVELTDNKQFFPPYNGAPVIREKTLKQYPEVGKLLNQMADKLNGDTMKELNYRVDVKHEDVSKVAREWLTKEGLIKE
ncbi:glycine betaine ABC transporter substrate-binding protein [Neobacillus niacini]|uniref:glycine betaine ABC transporter substrate-binding protein n=1 Tax=Neobacillus niacini TaxID=86668 RepID=UPI00286174E6|nr:glycine betaine ABC transporter substrate-binding protein [Neobacillus niacini]MDR7002224.1 osmoprotectant transport system substrate-binding protein [Neobacillus niacini]